MKNEADVKKEVKKILTRLGAWWYMSVTEGYGSHEKVDFMPVTINGYSIIIETKFGKRGLTKWQERALKNHANAGGLSLVINEKNVEALESLINDWLDLW